ncbi:hypothetical protein WJX74_004357 [Apatococcus lobatus]|uniref:Uncharacterized protein n=1 Tax=Apatococcus lobatus TaxID=904363 RepID=A0AAW1R3A0_9CHLO
MTQGTRPQLQNLNFVAIWLCERPSKSSPQQQTSFHAPQCLPPFPVVTVQTMASYRISWAVALVGLALLLCPQDAVSQTASPCPANQGTDNNGCGNTGAGNVGDYNAGSGNKGYCNQGSGLIGTGLSGGDAPGCRLTCPGGSNLAGQPAPGTPCAAGQTFQLTSGSCSYGLAQCCKCVGRTPTVVTPAPAPSIRKLAPAPAPGPGASAKAPGSAPSAAGAPSTVIPSRG